MQRLRSANDCGVFMLNFTDHIAQGKAIADVKYRGTQEGDRISSPGLLGGGSYHKHFVN